MLDCDEFPFSTSVEVAIDSMGADRDISSWSRLVLSDTADWLLNGVNRSFAALSGSSGVSSSSPSCSLESGWQPSAGSLERERGEAGLRLR